MKEKTNWMVAITQIDRRYIFILVALSVTIPLLLGISLPVNISPSVQSVYDYMDDIPDGGAVLIVLDYDPASEAELYPMTLALYSHCFERNLRVFSFTMWPNGAALIDQAFNEMEQRYGVERGEDYVNFGYQVGAALVIIAAGQNIRDAMPTDYRGNATAPMAVMEGIERLVDFDYVIDLAAGSTIDWWVIYGVERYNFTLGAGCTAVSATQYYPYLNTGQINGLLGGLKGAAEYEDLVNKGYDVPTGRGMAGMTAQSSVHAMIALLVVISNIFYFITRKK